jgi:hypothetical protein
LTFYGGDMASVIVAARVHSDIDDALEKEAKRRGQRKSALVKTYVLDGLAGNNNETEQVLQTLVSVLEHLKTLMSISGATLHLDVERLIFDLPKNPDEPPEEYRERLKTAYKQKVREAITKGGRIAAASSDPHAK